MPVPDLRITSQPGNAAGTAGLSRRSWSRSTAISAPPTARVALPFVPDRAGLVHSLLESARICFRAADFKAAEAFRALVPLATADPARAWYRAGQLHFARADYEAAGQAFGYAAAYDPADAGLQVRLAVTCLRLNDVPSFEAYLSRAMSLGFAHRAPSDFPPDPGSADSAG